MSTSAEQELRQRLSAVLDEMTPGPAPVGAVIRRGRGVRRRRIAGAAAAALAAAAAVAGFSWLGLRLPSQAPVAPRPPVVTVVRPGPGAPAGLIASGTVGRERWSARVTTSRPGWSACWPGRRPVLLGRHPTRWPGQTWNGVGATPAYRVLGRNGATPGDPRRCVLLADGQRLILHPSPGRRARRWVAVACRCRARGHPGRGLRRPVRCTGTRSRSTNRAEPTLSAFSRLAAARRGRAAPAGDPGRVRHGRRAPLVGDRVQRAVGPVLRAVGR